MSQTITIINQKINNIDRKSLLQSIDDAVVNKRRLTIATVNPEFIVLSVRNSQFEKVLASFDYRVADGFGIIAMSRLFGKRFTERITGVDLTYNLIKLSSQKQYKIVMLGASEKSALKACSKLRMTYPSLKIDCIAGGVINPNKISATLINEIKQAKPNILLVGLGSPKQEYFISNILKHLPPLVSMGIGGTIDFISETALRAPLWMQRFGIEWLWRLLREPRRYRRIFHATVIYPIYYILWKIFKANS